MPETSAGLASHRDSRLARLAENAMAGQWSGDTAIDWRQAPRLPFWVSRDQARDAVSQLYHGEIATSRMCRLLLEEVDDSAARDCLAFQLKDELRHASVYARYLEDLGGIAAMDDDLAWALAAAHDGPMRPLSTVLAFHIVIEGEVLRLQELLARFLPCPLLRQINHLVSRDEARHVAFGKIYLKAVLADLPLETRSELYGWIHDIWRQATAFADIKQPRRNVLERAAYAWLRNGWRHHGAALRRIGLNPTQSWDRAA